MTSTGFHSGCRNVSHQQQFFSELPLPGGSLCTTYLHSFVQTIYCCTKLFNPQVKRVTCRTVAIITKVSITDPWAELGFVSFCDTNAMICSVAWITSSTNHHNGTVTRAPVTPEWQATSTLQIAAAVHLTETYCGGVTATIAKDVTASAACVAVPNSTMSEVAVSCYKAPEGSAASAAAGVQQGCVRAVITPGYFDVISSDKPECRWNHVVVIWWTGNSAVWRCAVIPPATARLHPVCTVSIWETWDESPTTTIRGHITVHLIARKLNFFIKMHWYSPFLKSYYHVFD